MNQCPTCQELWGACADAALEVTRLTQEVERSPGDSTDDRVPELIRRLQTAAFDRAMLQSDLKIHLAVAHPDHIGMRASSIRAVAAAGESR